MIGDFNGDGKLDMAVGEGGEFNLEQATGGALLVLLGNGDGTFQPGTTYHNFPVWPGSGVVSDFNNDGNLDLILCDYVVTELFGNGDGTFRPGGTILPVTQLAQSAAVGDFNGDHNLDLAITSLGTCPPNGPCGGGYISVLLGNGDGTFQPAGTYSIGDGTPSIAVGDFNGDGKLDLVATSAEASNVFVFLGFGDGNFLDADTYDTGPGPGAVAIGDFNRDGALDLAVTGDSGVSVLLNNGNSSFQPPVNYDVGPDPNSVAVVDLNGDGFLDIVVVTGDNSRVVVLQGNGDGTFQPAVDYVTQTRSQALGVGDFNGDGAPDLAVANTFANSVSILLNTCVRPPSLTAARTSTGVILSWPFPSMGFSLESSREIGVPNWQAADEAPVKNGNIVQVSVSLTNLTQRYFRLHKL